MAYLVKTIGLTFGKVLTQITYLRDIIIFIVIHFSAIRLFSYYTRERDRRKDFFQIGKNQE